MFEGNDLKTLCLENILKMEIKGSCVYSSVQQ